MVCPANGFMGFSIGTDLQCQVTPESLILGKKTTNPNRMEITEQAAYRWGVKELRCAGIKTWDGVRDLAGVSFGSQNAQQKSETSVSKAENAFVSMLLYQT